MTLNKILVLHGPSLSELGRREPEVYGTTTLLELNTNLATLAQRYGLQIDTRQSNHEGVLIDALLNAQEQGFVAIIFNPAGYAHTSVALLDAMRAIAIPVIEVHLSNVHARETYRRRLVTAEGAVGVISGFGVDSYRLALMSIADRLGMKTL